MSQHCVQYVAHLRSPVLHRVLKAVIKDDRLAVAAVPSRLAANSEGDAIGSAQGKLHGESPVRDATVWQHRRPGDRRKMVTTIDVPQRLGAAGEAGAVQMLGSALPSAPLRSAGKESAGQHTPARTMHARQTSGIQTMNRRHHRKPSSLAMSRTPLLKSPRCRRDDRIPHCRFQSLLRGAERRSR